MTTGAEHEQLFILISWKIQGLGTPEDQLVRLNQPVGAVLEWKNSRGGVGIFHVLKIAYPLDFLR
jgi:hypothetical protein